MKIIMPLLVTVAIILSCETSLAGGSKEYVQPYIVSIRNLNQGSYTVSAMSGAGMGFQTLTGYHYTPPGTYTSVQFLSIYQYEGGVRAYKDDLYRDIATSSGSSFKTYSYPGTSLNASVEREYTGTPEFVVFGNLAQAVPSATSILIRTTRNAYDSQGNKASITYENSASSNTVVVRNSDGKSVATIKTSATKAQLEAATLQNVNKTLNIIYNGAASGTGGSASVQSTAPSSVKMAIDLGTGRYSITESYANTAGQVTKTVETSYYTTGKKDAEKTTVLYGGYNVITEKKYNVLEKVASTTTSISGTGSGSSGSVVLDPAMLEAVTKNVGKHGMDVVGNTITIYATSDRSCFTQYTVVNGSITSKTQVVMDSAKNVAYSLTTSTESSKYIGYSYKIQDGDVTRSTSLPAAKGIFDGIWNSRTYGSTVNVGAPTIEVKLGSKAPPSINPAASLVANAVSAAYRASGSGSLGANAEMDNKNAVMSQKSDMGVGASQVRTDQSGNIMNK